jgi:hypothetical protein
MHMLAEIMHCTPGHYRVMLAECVALPSLALITSEVSTLPLALNSLVKLSLRSLLFPLPLLLAFHKREGITKGRAIPLFSSLRFRSACRL